MDAITAAREQRKFKKLRTLGSSQYSCRCCGESDWRFRYEKHHVGHKRYSYELIWLCINCHDWISDMQKDQFPLPSGLPSEALKVVMMLKGHAELHQRSAEVLRSAALVIGAMMAANDNREAGQ